MPAKHAQIGTSAQTAWFQLKTCAALHDGFGSRASLELTSLNNYLPLKRFCFIFAIHFLRLFETKKGGYPSEARAAAAAKLQPSPQALDWQPALGPTLIKQATGEHEWARLKALIALGRHRVHFDQDQLLPVVRQHYGPCPTR